MRSVLTVVFCLAVVAGCGRVGDPLPPFVRIPEPAADLSAGQSGYDLELRWTTPARNVDFSASTDLAFAEIFADGELIQRMEAVAGAPQSFRVGARNLAGIPRVYTIRFVTTDERISALSNEVSFAIISVPEGGASPNVVVDQGRVRLSWPAPAVAPDLATAYRVYRDGALLAGDVRTRAFEDTEFEPGVEYTYRIVPIRDSDGRLIEGIEYTNVAVEAVDRAPPAPPADPDAVTFDQGVFLRWAEGAETDLAAYRVYRIDGEEAVLIGESATTGFNVVGAGSGAAFAVTAVDASGNESTPSEPVVVP